MLLAGTNAYEVMSAPDEVDPIESPAEPVFDQCSAATDPKLTDVQSRGSVICTAVVVTLSIVSIRG